MTLRRPLLELNPRDSRHGTPSGYRHHGCRCLKCRTANARQAAEYRARRRARPVPRHVHGTVNGYTNYGCRCLACTRANTAANARRKGNSVLHHPVVHRTERNRLRPACGVVALAVNLVYASRRSDVTCGRCLRARVPRPNSATHVR